MTSRNQSLDVLRGIAVLMVVCWHYALVTHQESQILSVGACGVDLFFVLSGFLISGLLFGQYKATGTISLKRFWIRRGFKIYPPFYAFMAASIIIFLSISHRVPREMLSELTLTQNYLPHVWPHTWSLAVEEHFYFVLPILFALLIWFGKGRANPFRAIPVISIVISMLCLYLRIVAIRHGADWEHVGFPTHLRMDALLAGVALGYFSHFDQASFREARRWWILAIGLAFSLALLILPDALRNTFAYVAFSFIVAWAANRGRSNFQALRILAWVGYYSYSVYLWHALVMVALPYAPARWFRLPAYLLAVLALGIGLSKLIEIPSLRLRDRLFPSQMKPRATSVHLDLCDVQRIAGCRSGDGHAVGAGAD